MPRFSIKLSPLQRILVYGAAMGLLVFLLKWLQWKYLITDHSIEIYGGVLALIFTALGVWIANQCLFSSELYLQTDTCAGSNFSTQTNSGGTAVFQNLPVGTHYLFAQWKSGPIDLKLKQAIIVTAEMRKDTLVLQ